MPPKDYDEYEGNTLKLSEEAYRKMFEGCSRGFFVMEDDVVSPEDLEETTMRKEEDQMERKSKHIWPGMEVD